jgi:hypothetical protein
LICRFLTSALFVFLSAGFLRANVCSAVGACGANWQTFMPPIQHAQAPGPSGRAYFDGFSWDGPNANIADFIEGQGAFLGNPLSPKAMLPFWGNANGTASSSFFFQSGGQSVSATLLLTSSDWKPSNSLGWYDPYSSAWGWVFKANGTPPVISTTVSFSPTANFGLFFAPHNLNFQPGDPAYYTDSSLNGIAAQDVAYAAANGITLGSEALYQHFAVFLDPNGTYYIGVKDRSLQVGDSDYNDMVFSMTTNGAVTPEPGLFGVLAGMLAGLAAARVYTRRRAIAKHGGDA